MFSKVWVQDAGGRLARTFIQGYAAFWAVAGQSYNTLFTSDNLKAGVVAAAISFFMSMGATQFGNPHSASFLK